MGYIKNILGKDGLFSGTFPDYAPRSGQIRMAEAVDQAIQSVTHLLVEAPCGVGKSVAYCLPAIAHARTNRLRTVIATANINLQEQLVNKDLPTLAKILPWRFTYALLKGRNNYFCKSRTFDARVDGSLDALRKNPRYAEQVTQLTNWARTTNSGDRSHLNPGVDDAVWGVFSTSSDGCRGKECTYCDSCFYNMARDEAATKDIIVTNYHMLFAHLAVKRALEVDIVLPPFDVLIMDEGHEAAGVARDFFGTQLSAGTFKPIARYVEKTLRKPKIAYELTAAVSELFDFVKRLGQDKVRYNTRLRQPLWDEGHSGDLLEKLESIITEVELITKSKDKSPEDKKEARLALRLASSARGRLKLLVNMEDPNQAYWIDLELGGRYPRVSLRSAPIFVDQILGEDLFGKIKTVVVTSATISTGGNFDFIKGELGAPATTQCLAVESPFDYSKQSLLVVPHDADDVKDPKRFCNIVTAAVSTVLESCNGHTMALFTSKRSMQAVGTAIRNLLPHRKIVVQGEEFSRTEIQRQFKSEEADALFGVASFWTGIDIPGEALTGLVIDKIPFPNIGDPVVDAISANLGRKAFFSYSVPRAVITLKQGIGRLIRTTKDYGVVVITDNRISTHPAYAKAFLTSLPPMLYANDMAHVQTFIAQKQKEKTQCETRPS
jgi:ATP-dependent DNA helicase DinG